MLRLLLAAACWRSGAAVCAQGGAAAAAGVLDAARSREEMGSAAMVEVVGCCTNEGRGEGDAAVALGREVDIRRRLG